MQDQLVLKWGTLKGYSCATSEFKEALEKYLAFGFSPSAAMQSDTSEQKEALCEVIDACSGTIHNDWSGKEMTKEEATKYVLNY